MSNSGHEIKEGDMDSILDVTFTIADIVKSFILQGA